MASIDDDGRCGSGSDNGCGGIRDWTCLVVEEKTTVELETSSSFLIIVGGCSIGCCLGSDGCAPTLRLFLLLVEGGPLLLVLVELLPVLIEDDGRLSMFLFIFVGGGQPLLPSNLFVTFLLLGQLAFFSGFVWDFVTGLLFIFLAQGISC